MQYNAGNNLDGTVRALDAKTGCLRWEIQASAEVRTAIIISPWSADDSEADPTLYCGGGAIVANGMIYVNSAYGIFNHMPGNLLLAIGPKE